jgi:hypothetical protein
MTKQETAKSYMVVYLTRGGEEDFVIMDANSKSEARKGFTEYLRGEPPNSPIFGSRITCVEEA